MQLSRFYQIHYQSSQLITSLTRLIYQLSATSTLSSSYHYVPPNLPFISTISPIVWQVNFQNIEWLSRALCVAFFFLLSLQIRVNTISRLYMWSLAAFFCNIFSNILFWCAKMCLMLYRVRRESRTLPFGYFPGCVCLFTSSIPSHTSCEPHKLEK